MPAFHSASFLAEVQVVSAVWEQVVQEMVFVHCADYNTGNHSIAVGARDKTERHSVEVRLRGMKGIMDRNVYSSCLGKSRCRTYASSVDSAVLDTGTKGGRQPGLGRDLYGKEWWWWLKGKAQLPLDVVA